MLYLAGVFYGCVVAVSGYGFFPKLVGAFVVRLHHNFPHTFECVKTVIGYKLAQAFSLKFPDNVKLSHVEVDVFVASFFVDDNKTCQFTLVTDEEREGVICLPVFFKVDAFIEAILWHLPASFILAQVIGIEAAHIL